jgi:DNA-binding transcriptional ArsR family regulator
MLGALRDNGRENCGRQCRRVSRPMITIPLSTEDLTRMRFAPDPLAETILSYRALLKPAEHAVHLPWVYRARRALRGMDLSPLAALFVGGHACPDFLTSPSAVSLPSFGEQVVCLRETPTDLVTEDVEHFVYQATKVVFCRPLSPRQAQALGGYLRAPRVSLDRLADTLLRYHELAIAPYWPRMRELLEGDVLKRGQALALGGAEALFSGINPSIRYREGNLELDRSYDAVVTTAGRGITLVPCIFAWPRVSVNLHSHWQPTLAYPPRGTANLWTSSSRPSSETALGAALGDSRARVLRGLILTPTTTTRLSQQLGLAPAAVSAHLSRLKAAGLVEPHRSGRKVYYRLSYAGESLLEVFGETG